MVWTPPRLVLSDLFYIQTIFCYHDENVELNKYHKGYLLALRKFPLQKVTGMRHFQAHDYQLVFFICLSKYKS